jgi:hypothetical protein
MLEPLLYFGGTILATVVVAVLLCHYRVAHQKRISWGTVFSSSVIANVSIFLGMGIYEEGWHIFTREAWTGGKGGLDQVLFVLGVIIILCILPALGVTVYYQRRTNRNEKHVV